MGMATPAIKLKPIETIVQKWAERAKAGLELYKIYTASPKRDPTAAAISMKSTIQAKMSKPETWAKWENALRNVGFSGWLYGVQTKGVQRFTGGIDAGAPYMNQFMSQFLPHLAAGLAEVYRLPKVTLEDSIARAAAMIRHNAKFTFNKRGLTASA